MEVCSCHTFGSHGSPMRSITATTSLYFLFFFPLQEEEFEAVEVKPHTQGCLERGGLRFKFLLLLSLCLQHLWPASCFFPLRLWWSQGSSHHLFLTIAVLHPFGPPGSCQTATVSAVPSRHCGYMLDWGKGWWWWAISVSGKVGLG